MSEELKLCQFCGGEAEYNGSNIECRDAFEKWADDRHYGIEKLPCGEYESTATGCALEGWQARQQEIDQLVAALKNLEWSAKSPNGMWQCPVCGSHKLIGHRNDCPFNALLAKYRGARDA